LAERTTLTLCWFLHFEQNNFIFFEVCLSILVAFAKKDEDQELALKDTLEGEFSSDKRKSETFFS